MNWSVIHKRVHTWAGLASAVFLLIICITGVMLNHPVRMVAHYPEEVLSLAIDPQNPKRIYQGRVDGLWLSEDQGDSWVEIDMLYPPQELVDIQFRPGTPQHIYLLQKWHGILSSRDGGAIWDVLALPFDPQEKNIELKRIAVSSNGDLALMTSGGMLHSNDQGEVWNLDQFNRDKSSYWHLVKNIHSGHFFGEWFVRVYDLVVVAVILLIITGLVMWRMKDKRV